MGAPSGWSGRRRACLRSPSWGIALPIAPRGERQDRFFCPREIERLFEDLGFQGLAPEQALEVAHTLLELADLAGPDHVLVGMDGLAPAFQHPALPGKELAWRDAGATGHQRNRHARLHGLLDQADLLGGRPAPSALHGRDDFHTRRGSKGVRRHSRIHRRMPMPYRAMPPVRSKRGAVQYLRDSIFEILLVIPYLILRFT